MNISRLASVPPYPNLQLYQWSFKAHLMWCWRVLPVKQALMNSYSRKRQTVDSALVFPKAMAQDGLVFTFTWTEEKGLWFYMCRGSILYCIVQYVITEKKSVSVGKVGALKIFLLLFCFPLQKVLLPFLDEVNCARRIKFWFVFISCMLSSLLLIPLFNCSLCWMCEAVKHSNSGYCLCWTM